MQSSGRKDLFVVLCRESGGQPGSLEPETRKAEDSDFLVAGQGLILLCRT